MADMPYAKPAIRETTEHVDSTAEIVDGDINHEAEVKVAQPYPTHNAQNSDTSLRRSSKDKAPPLWLKDYVATKASSSCVYSLDNYLSYECLSPK